MRDLSTLLWITGASCIVVPWLICRSLPRPENNSRAIRRYVEKRAADRHADRDGFADDPRPAELISSFHFQPISAEAQRNHV